MSDFKILESRGYEELDQIDEDVASGALDWKVLWAASQDDAVAEIVEVLNGAGWEFDVDEVESVKVVLYPDHGKDRHRVWVKTGKPAEPDDEDE